MTEMDWKSRYHQALESLENEAQAARRIEYRLREALARLAVAAIGHDVAVDRDLGRLRDALRAGDPVETIHSLVGEVSERVRRLREPTGGEAPAPRLRDSMLHVLELLEGAVPDAEALERLRSSTRHASLHELAGLHPELTRQLEAGFQQMRRPGLLDRLFSRGKLATGPSQVHGSTGAVPGDAATRSPDDPDTPAMHRVLAVAMADRSLPDRLRQQLRGLMQEEEPERLGEELARLLANLPADTPEPSSSLPAEGTDAPDPTEEMPAAQASEDDTQPVATEAIVARIGTALDQLAGLLEDSGEADRVRQELTGSPTPERLPELIAALGGAMQAHRETLEGEKQALRDFIQELMGRIGKLESSLQQARGGDREYDSRAEDMDSRIQEGLSGIGRELQEVQDLARLRDLMRQRLDELEERYQERRRMESQHRARAAENLNRMTDQIQSLQSEIRDLRERLNEARADSRMDSLTRLPNRRAYHERLRYEAARFKRFARPLSLVLLDIDDFKSLNDNFGHRVGDRTLTRLAGVLSHGLRESDFLARYGGEEFVLLLPETGMDESLEVIERQRRQVAETRFEESGVRLPVTISAGIASFTDGDRAEAVFERADKALYRAKEAGRNRCMTESSDTDEASD